MTGDLGAGAAVGGRLVGAAVAGVLVLGGGVATAAPASAASVVSVVSSADRAVQDGRTGPTPVRATPERAPQLRAGLRAHRITDHAASRRTRKVRRSVVGRALDAVFGWFAVAALVVLLVVVLLVYAVRRRNGR
ncbi:hypothetical protein ABZW30_05800 [Kitasatospora sp. NPDC004669]|uniref:hypothetical protein n=1 Tax=Kitasatospora sp. NPDC004669 TaxID=3154555 RepID=UPI0033B3AE6D